MIHPPSPPPPPQPRGARPDAEDSAHVYLIKNVSVLHATYQVRLLGFLAGQRGKQLVLQVPAVCRFDPELEALVGSPGSGIRREDLP